ncbi:MAG: hypothetical protein QM621_14430 [Aeromicrobium sp.]|uniref:hypothetical protein n=1 Tax=Aeromicrobium sp. TaxID=1871063 RepID=UPI0039E5DD35
MVEPQKNGASVSQLSDYQEAADRPVTRVVPPEGTGIVDLSVGEKLNPADKRFFVFVETDLAASNLKVHRSMLRAVEANLQGRIAAATSTNGRFMCQFAAGDICHDKPELIRAFGESVLKYLGPLAGSEEVVVRIADLRAAVRGELSVTKL